MLRSSTQSARSHGDNLGPEYLWNGDEYSSFEKKKQFQSNRENAEYEENKKS